MPLSVHVKDSSNRQASYDSLTYTTESADIAMSANNNSYWITVC